MNNTDQNAPIVIGNTEITPVFYQGQAVITLAMMDKVHSRPEGTAKRNFNEHKEKLIVNEDFFSVCSDEIRTSKIMGISPKHTKNIYLLTETGYLLLVKSFTDDLAWQIQRQLVKAYFAVKQSPAPPTDRLTPNDERNLKNVIWCICNHMRYTSSWQLNILAILRERTGTPSPQKYAIKDLPVIASELRTVLNAAVKLSDYTSQLEKEIIKALRAGADVDAILAREQTTFNTKVKELTDDSISVLDQWEIKQLQNLADLVAMSHQCGNTIAIQ